ncbi:DUF6017 domain-containing protein [Blautia sp.]|uniref:DUF6017 domain-containing protein n=1 Tax=Blautia sp. TaxID=1955243 RepID=UPI00351FB7E1
MQIHENIGYEQFKQTYPGDIELIDEFVNVMLDVLLSEGGVIRINGEVKSRELAQSQIVKLEYADVEYVLMQFKQQKERIKKKIAVYSIHAVSITLGEKTHTIRIGYSQMNEIITVTDT